MRVATLVLGGLVSCLFLGQPPKLAAAQSWPTQTVKIVTPFPTGSGGDVTARLFAGGLARRWAQPVVVENRPGADGIIAVTAVLNATDGHTILYTNGGPLTSSQIAHAGKLTYDPVRDLLPISGGMEVFVAIGVPAALSTGTIAAFVQEGKLKQGQLNWAATPGTLDYLLPGFFKTAGIELTQVRYRDVTAAMQDLSQSRIQFYAAAVATQLPMSQSGAIKLIAVTNKERAPGLPDVPTATEAGFPDLQYEAFLGFFGPRGMPVEIRERISNDVQAIGKDDGLTATFHALGMKVRTTTPAGLDKLVTDERAALARITGSKP